MLEEEKFFVTIVNTPWWDIAAVVFGGVTLFLFAWILWYTRKTAEAATWANERADAEMAVRLRPWLGVGDVKYEITAVAGHDAVTVFFENVGSLPAHDVVYSFDTTPDHPDHSWLFPKTLGTIMPHEHSNEQMAGPLLSEYRGRGDSFTFTGSFKYCLAENAYVTKFTGEYNFRRVMMTFHNFDVT